MRKDQGEWWEIDYRKIDPPRKPDYRNGEAVLPDGSTVKLSGRRIA